MKKILPLGFLTFFAVILLLDAKATVVVTTDPSVVTSFQAGATVENFDDLPGLTITSYSSGQTVPATNQFSSRDLATFTAPFFNSGGATFSDPVSNPGTPIGIFTPSGAIAGDVKSGTNVAGPLAVGTDEAFNNGFMEVIFPTNVQLVGFWITHASAPITLFLKDNTNMNLSTGDFQVTGSEGQFIGIRRDSADIGGITIGFTESFTIDDFTYSSVPTTVPDSASTMILLGMALAGLILFAGRRTVAAVR